jgi:type I restriction enzyme S subunit
LQQKIATFLSAVDDKTQQLNKKKALLERYKKGVMQQIFSQEIRFKDDEGKDYPKWQKKRLGDVVTRVSTKNKQVSSNVLTISAQEGLISQLKYFNNSVAGKSLFGYTLIMRDDFAYNKSYSKGYPMGAIKRLTRYEKGIVSTLYICFRTNKDITPQFAEHYFESGRQNQEIEKVAQEGARNHGLLNIGVGDFFSIEMDLPCVPEQTKIACFLSALDDIIGHVNQQTELIKQYKIGLLQQMFV